MDLQKTLLKNTTIKLLPNNTMTTDTTDVLDVIWQLDREVNISFDKYIKAGKKWNLQLTLVRN